MKSWLFWISVVLALLLVHDLTAQESSPLSEEPRELTQIESDVKELDGWSRQAVMVDRDGDRLIDPSGTVASAADAAAVEEAANSVGEIADAAKDAVHEAATELTEAAEGTADKSLSYAVYFAPETTRLNMTGYVVEESTDGVTDTQWVWFNRKFAVPPVRWVEYQGEYITNLVKATWKEWTAAGTTRTVEGRVWSGCHRCTIDRPSWAVGVPCLTLPNDIVGGQSGFDLGEAAIILDDQLPFTGYCTNRVENVVEYYSNGLLKERTAL